jgi:hypothetical protein
MKMKYHHEVYPYPAFIVKRGKVSQPLKELIKEMRFIMYPNTATKLKVPSLYRKAKTCLLKTMCTPPRYMASVT